MPKSNLYLPHESSSLSRPQPKHREMELKNRRVGAGILSKKHQQSLMEQYPDTRQRDLPIHHGLQQIGHGRHAGSLDVQAAPLQSISPVRRPAQRRVNIIEADAQDATAVAPLHIRSSQLPSISSTAAISAGKQYRSKVNLRYGKAIADSVDVSGSLQRKDRSRHRRMVRESYEEGE